MVSRVLRIEPAFLSSSSYGSDIFARSKAMCCSPRLSTGMQPSTSLTQLLSGAGRVCSTRSAPLVRKSATSASFTEPFFIFCSGPPSVRLTMTIGAALIGASPPPLPKLQVRRMVSHISAELRKALAPWKVESYSRTQSGPRRHDWFGSESSGIVERSVTDGVIEARCQP
eukprot:7391972-Prymnesium_polylepis.1